MKRIKLINSKTVFISTLVVLPTLVLIVFLSGLEAHRSLYLNSLISTTVLSIVFVLFITTGLYNGWKLKDSIGNFNLSFRASKPRDLSGFDAGSFDFIDGDEGVVAILLAILLWVVIAIFGSLVFYYVGGLLWLTLLSTAAVLYWIIFRAFRLIFKHSARCKGKLLRSFGIAVAYTLLYNCWIYAIIFGVHYLRNI